MTANQNRAVSLANEILRGTVDASELSDFDWNLLLLAGGVFNSLSLPLQVAGRVFHQFTHRKGYFAEIRNGLSLTGPSLKKAS